MTKHQRVTQMNGNAENNIRGSRVSIWTDDGEIVDQFIVPKWNGPQYCKDYPGGKYGKRYQAAIVKAEAH